MKIRTLIRPSTHLVLLAFASSALAAAPAHATGQPEKDAKAIVAAAVDTELKSDRTDHTAYSYRDHDITPDHDTLYFTVETPQGNLSRKLEDHGKPLTPEQRAAEDARIQGLVADAAAMQKQRHDAHHDDQQAEEMLKLLPRAYLWTIASEQGDLITLNFKPDPAFQPESMEARVLSAMAGSIVVARGQNRIRTIKGTLVEDVKFGFGIFGRLHKGGSFQVERREVAPQHWQMTENHVRLEGHALFFKTIGSVEDQVRSDFKPSSAGNLKEANDLLNAR